MSRILFVDDEPAVLSGLRRAAHATRTGWDAHFTTEPEAALEHIRTSDIDVLVTDIQMPGMDGVALLEHVRAEAPHVARIALSGEITATRAMACMCLAHRLLAKPCDFDVLRDAVDSAIAVRSVVNRAAACALHAASRVAGPPTVIAELELVLRGPEPQIADVAAVVRRDATLTLKALQLVNSAYFGLARTITSVDEAVHQLGVGTVRNLAAALAAMEDADNAADPLLRDLHAHAVTTAQLAAEAAPAAGVVPSEAYVAGLLHDIGWFILAAWRPASFQQYFADTSGFVPEFADLDREIQAFGVSHTQLGGALLSLWGLPEQLIGVAALHHARDGSTPLLALVQGL